MLQEKYSYEHLEEINVLDEAVYNGRVALVEEIIIEATVNNDRVFRAVEQGFEKMKR